MKRVIAVGVALSVLMLLPATLPNVVHVSYAVPPTPVVEVHTPFVMAPVTPLSEGVGARVIKDITLSTDTAENDLIFLSKWELLDVLAQTGWRSYITANMVYIEELDM